jgi:hypothetical protein
VVEKKLRCVARKSAEVVEKKSRAFFHASDEVVEKARPAAEKKEAEVVEKKSRLFFQTSALDVEKKNPLSMFVRYEEASEVVAMTLPCALVERRPERMLEMAKEVVVAFVVLSVVALKKVEVAFVKMLFVAKRFVLVAFVVVPKSESMRVIVDDPAMRPLENERMVVVALFGKR